MTSVTGRLPAGNYDAQARPRSQGVRWRTLTKQSDTSFDLSDKVVLVTGGGRGVGRGITDRFIDAGADVVICGRHEPEDAGKATFIGADVRDWDQVDQLVTSIVDRFGRLDVAVNNAGGAPAVPAATASPRFSAAIITLNLVGPLYVAQRANEVMQAQPEGGSIINSASVSGMRP